MHNRYELNPKYIEKLKKMRFIENLNLKVNEITKYKCIGEVLNDGLKHSCIRDVIVGDVICRDNWDGWDGIRICFEVLSLNKYKEVENIKILSFSQMNHSKRKMIKKKSYRDAMLIVDRYNSQAHDLLKKGDKIIITKAHSNSNINIGDVLDVESNFFDENYVNSPVVFVLFNNKEVIITKESGWDYDIMKK